MSRLRANILLLVSAMIWGTAFIAQKMGMNGLGPFGFVGVRFTLSALVILPLALRELSRRPRLELSAMPWTGALCGVFFLAVVLQQAGMITASVTNGAFLTSVYIIVVPLAAWGLFRLFPAPAIWPACALALGGVFLLNGGRLTAFTTGDWQILACALFFGFHVAIMGYLAGRTGRPLTLAVLQYAFTALLGLAFAAAFEGIGWAAIAANWIPLAYAGLVSGGIAYTLQAVAQQYTPPAVAGVIFSSEALFAAFSGALIMGDRLSSIGWAGCAMIFAALLLVELGPRFCGGKAAADAGQGG